MRLIKVKEILQNFIKLNHRFHLKLKRKQIFIKGIIIFIIKIIKKYFIIFFRSDDISRCEKHKSIIKDLSYKINVLLSEIDKLTNNSDKLIDENHQIR